MTLSTIDQTPRYTPDAVFCRRLISPVRQAVVHPPNAHERSPIRNELTALELVTANGSRWYGITRGYINSELRMVVEGTNARDEVRMGWSVVPEDCRDGR